MKKSENVFQRYEKKYVVTKEQYIQLLEKIQPYMKMDQYGHHSICNIYYDTDTYELIRKSIEKPVYKEKIRLRSYGIPNAQSMTYLELKKKVDGIVYKTRTSMAYQSALDYLEGKEISNSNQIIKEIDWFTHIHKVKPKVMLAYDRVAYFGKEDPEIRMTFDTNVRYRLDNLDLALGDKGQLLMDDSQYILEIKIQYSMPLWMSQLLSELKIYPTSYSKYGMCYKQCIAKEVQYVQ